MTAPTMPAITHVAVTVTDMTVSEAWYTSVLGVEPVIDEDTGPFRHIVYPHRPRRHRRRRLRIRAVVPRSRQHRP